MTHKLLDHPMPSQPHEFPDFVTNDKRYQEAKEYMKSATAKPGRDYEYSLSYAKDLWASCMAIHRQLDEKSNRIITYLGGGTGLFALGVLSKIDAMNYVVAITTFVPVVLALIAIWHAIGAFSPGFAPGQPSVKSLVTEYVDSHETDEEGKGAFLGQWHLACVGMQIVCGYKANLLERATRLYFWALLTLLIPVAVSVFMAVVQSPKTPQGQMPQMPLANDKSPAQ
jgi:hypothetical protein